MKLQNLTVIFIIIIIPVILLQSAYISNGIKTINYQSLYDTGLVSATHDAIYAYELNTLNDVYSSNVQTKREILNASIKMFERSLCKTCNISEFKTKEIENYIPAIVFGMYDGFYLYASTVLPVYGEPDENGLTVQTGSKNEHTLKSYIYYSEQTTDDITIRYALDNYVVVSGNLPDYSGGDTKYRTMSGYLSAFNDDTEIDNNSYDGSTYQGISINDEKAKEYYKESKEFTKWFLKKAKLQDKKKKIKNLDGTETEQTMTYLGVSTNNNDPENPNSPFTQHKQEIIKNKIETVLNSTITAYSNRVWGNTFKMPKISPDNWEKVYADVSMITFFQGKNIGLTEYNGYCVLNSNNTHEYINPNLIYFLDSTADSKKRYYHDIRCTHIDNGSITKGYNISRFHGKTITGASANIETKYKDTSKYVLDYYWCYRKNDNIERIKRTDQKEKPDNTDIAANSDLKNYIYTRIFIYDVTVSPRKLIKSIYIYPDNTKAQVYNEFKTADNSLSERIEDDSYVPLACYYCINSSVTATLHQEGKEYTTVYDYIKPKDGTALPAIKSLYWTSLARERYNQPKLGA